MKKLINDNWVYLFFRMSVLIFALVCVIYAMKYTQTPEFTHGISDIFGLNVSSSKLNSVHMLQKTNWCPKNSHSITIVPSGIKIDTIELLDAICNTEVQSATAKEFASIQFNSALIAKSEFEEKKMLFSIEHSFFNIDGLIFKSEALSKELKNMLQK